MTVTISDVRTIISDIPRFKIEELLGVGNGARRNFKATPLKIQLASTVSVYKRLTNSSAIVAVSNSGFTVGIDTGTVLFNTAIEDGAEVLVDFYEVYLSDLYIQSRINSNYVKHQSNDDKVLKLTSAECLQDILDNPELWGVFRSRFSSQEQTSLKRALDDRVKQLKEQGSPIAVIKPALTSV